MASARGVSFGAPRLPDPFGSLLPHPDPFRQPGRSPGGDAQGGFERSAWPPAVSRVLLVEREDQPRPLGQQVAAAFGNLPQFGNCVLNVERRALPKRLLRTGSGELGEGVS